MLAALSGHISPPPLLAEWATKVDWPGPDGAAVVGVRPMVTGDLDVVRAAVLSQTPVIVVGAAQHTLDGVREVLERDCQPHELIAAMLVLLRRPPGPGKAVTHSEPTRRELEVVTLLARGLSNREIASELFISEHTVRNHLGHVFNKLGVSSRTQAVMRAGQVGWLRLPG